MNRGNKSLYRQKRDKAIRREYANGATIRGLADKWGLSQRLVIDILEMDDG